MVFFNEASDRISLIMDLKSLSDSELLMQTENTVAREREFTGLVLEHLREIEARRLYAKLGFSSLFQYCVQQLKYCNASAQLRIDAMRLARELPEVKDQLNAGSVSLSSVGALQRFFRYQKKRSLIHQPTRKPSFYKLKTSREKKPRSYSLRLLPKLFRGKESGC